MCFGSFEMGKYCSFSELKYSYLYVDKIYFLLIGKLIYPTYICNRNVANRPKYYNHILINT
jgi:hypothetical protein